MPPLYSLAGGNKRGVPMAYIDQKTGGNQRAAAIAIVTLIQGAAIVALINGLAVKWIERPPPTPTEGEQIPLTPIPTPIPPPPTPINPIERPEILPPQPLPPIAGPIQHPTPIPIASQPVPTQTYSPPVPPTPVSTGVAPRAPKPRNAPSGWVTSNDYPARDLREGNQGVTGFTLTIGADGKVQSCAVTRSSGYSGLDKATCDNISRRARFEPATDGSGNRTSGTYNGNIRWQIPQD